MQHCKLKSFQVHLSGIVQQRYNYPPKNEYFKCKYFLIIRVNREIIETILRFWIFSNWQDVLRYFSLVSCYTEFEFLNFEFTKSCFGEQLHSCSLCILLTPSHYFSYICRWDLDIVFFHCKLFLYLWNKIYPVIFYESSLLLVISRRRFCS